MTVSLTDSESNNSTSKANEMTSTTSTDTTACNAELPPSPPVTEDKDSEVAAGSPVRDELATNQAGGDETEEETDGGGGDETNLVINLQSESDSQVQTKQTSSPKSTTNATETVSAVKRSRDLDSDEEKPDSGPVDSECDVKKLKPEEPVCPEPPSVGDVAEMARSRAAKFIQERTKMACLLPASAEVETVKHHTSPTTTTATSHTSRKRKLTVKDILVSQRNRDHSNKQRAPPTTNSAENHVFPGLGQILDPNQQMPEQTANPLAAFTAALAAAAAAASGTDSAAPTTGIDSQSAYISTLASTLSANANPTAALALMASLGAMMQNCATTNNAKDVANSDSVINPLSQLANNSLANLESTLTNQFGAPAADDEEEQTTTPRDSSTAPLDFSRKSSCTSSDPSPEKKRKSRKKSNGFENEDDSPLDLSVSNKRPDEPNSVNKGDSSLSAMLAQMAQPEGANGGNFAAMAAAAAAAAASFSPNLLTRMAASMAPWANYGIQAGVKTNASDPTAAFAALFQQVNNATNGGGAKSANTHSANSGANNSTSGPSLFQSFPDLYWNGKLNKNSSTTSPSFGGLSNSASSLSARHHHHAPPPAASQPMRTKSSSGRQNPWQAQWINRSSEQTRDVFTCVWCKESFKSLAEMTDHMKRSPRCGMAGMQQHHSHHHSQPGHQPSPSPAASPASTPSAKLHSPSSAKDNHQHHHNHSHHHANTNTSSSSSTTNNTTNVANPLISSVKAANVNMPRKLVRGQDVWLGRGAEQTRQILKCMWCGQSFKSLADMTQHMKITQHYTNIISQEQIISWRTPEEKMNQSQVNAVLTCKVCDEAFGSLKELSNHMIKNSHFKENGRDNGSTRSDVSTPTTPPASATGNSRSGSNSAARTTTGAVSSDRRKKSLPVRKLLELEREEYRKSGDDDDEMEDNGKSSQLIECDDCHEKIEPRCFLQHIKQCRLKNAAKSDAESEKSKSDKASDEAANKSQTEQQQQQVKEEADADDDAKSESKKKETKDSKEERPSGEEPSSSGSVLSALEKLIEKNFDTKSRRSQQTGILQRLGIDEEVFPPWQNMAPSPLNAMSPTMAAWNNINGMEFSRSNSSSSSNSRINSVPPVMPQLRYRRNSSSASLKDKFFTGPSNKATESNGSFSSQETEEEESCDDSNSDCGTGTSVARRKKKATYQNRNQINKSRLNFPISSMLSSPIPNRPTSASSTASSISPSEPVTPSQATGEQLQHRMTPNSHRSNQEETDDELDSPLALCKKTFIVEEPEKKCKTNGVEAEDTDEEAGTGENTDKGSHHPLMQLQKLLDKTNHSVRQPRNGPVNNQRMSPFTGWHDPASIKALSPASSPLTPPTGMQQHSPSSASTKSEQDATSYLLLKCAFCDTQIASRASYRSHLAKYHLSMRDSVDLSAISDEELLLLVLAKNSNLPFGSSHGNLLATAPPPTSRSRGKESKRKSKSTWDKSQSTAPSKSPSPSPQLETSQSKFLKYTELAKQLSSKYV